MRLSAARLNRTLLARQHLLERVDATPHAEVEHLVGLQAQDPLPPYLGLCARLRDLDPHAVGRALEERSLVRLLTLRGTIHLLTPDDALRLRPWVQPRLEQELRVSPTARAARDVDRDAFAAAVDEALAGGPLPQPALGAALAERLEGYDAAALGQVARLAAPLVQVPPRGVWGAGGGVVYERVGTWVGRPLVEPGPEVVRGLVRRYLRAFGPARAADVTAWSGITRLGPVLAGMDDLVQHEDERGRVLHDVPDGVLAEADVPAPVRLLGCYDNLWLAHAERDRVTTPETRATWAGVNGGTAHTIFVDGWLTGLWRVEGTRAQVVSTVRDLTRAERAGLDEEIARVEALLAR